MVRLIHRFRGVDLYVEARIGTEIKYTDNVC